MMTSHIPQPWEQYPDESDMAFAAFRKYLYGALPRRVKDLPAQSGALATMKAWAKRFEWDLRCRPHDQQIDEAVRQDITRQHIRAQAKLFAAADVLIEFGATALTLLAKQLTDADDEEKVKLIHKIHPRQMIKAIAAASDIIKQQAPVKLSEVAAPINILNIESIQDADSPALLDACKLLKRGG